MIVGIDATLAALLEGQRAQEQRDRELAERLERIERKIAPKLASVDEAAQALGLCKATVQRLCKAGKLPGARKHGHVWRIDLTRCQAVSQDEVVEAAAAARALKVFP